MKQASVGGITLEYDVSGSGEPVVLIHGALTADTFRPLQTEPALKQYQIVSYHRRGYGGAVRQLALSAWKSKRLTASFCGDTFI